MALTLAFRNKYRLWGDLVRGNRDRLFIPTPAELPLGNTASIQCALPNSSMPVVVRGTVVARRGKSLRYPAGVFVQFSNKELERARRLLGMTPQPPRGWARRDVRHHCALHARLLTQSGVEERVQVKNLSNSGLLLACNTRVQPGEQLSLMLVLDSGEEASVQAQVTWTGHTDGLVGVRFVGELEEGSLVGLAACVQRLASLRRGSSNRVVVADDDADILHMLSSVLSRHGYDVSRASDGEEAEGLIHELQPALVVMDILMPGMDGVDICRRMRADAEMVDVPVIFVSALDAETLDTLADDAGATDWLTKPLAMADLLNLAGHYLRLGQPKAVPAGVAAQA